MTSVLVPAQEVRLPGGLVCRPREVDVGVWQAHVVKHPLGLGALWRGGVWNEEGWDRGPAPAIGNAEREAQIAAMRALDTNSRCGVRELRGGNTPVAPKEPCYVCEAPLVVRCSQVLQAPGAIGSRYRETLEAMLCAVADGESIVVPRLELAKRLMASLNRPGWLEQGLVLAVGSEGTGKNVVPMVRIARGDGTRVDFWLNGGTELAWKTTYRVPQASTHTRWSFLMKHHDPNPRLPLSDVYVVARGWWEGHGS